MDSHDHHHEHHHGIGRNIRFAFFLNLGFTVVEIVGGFLTNSVAILSDAVHDLGDTVTLAISWSLEILSEKEATEKLTFGYKRFSLLGALISSFILLAGSAFILTEAIPRLFHPEEVDPDGMIVLSVIGVLINGIAVLRLKGGKKLNEQVVRLHLLEDALGWIAVFIVSIILKISYVPVLDPILSIGITVFILFKIIPRLRDAIKIFLQYSPANINIREIKNELMKIDMVKDVHDIHLWSIDGTYNIFSSHVALSEDLGIERTADIKEAIRAVLLEYGIQHVTLEFEIIGGTCVSCD